MTSLDTSVVVGHTPGPWKAVSYTRYDSGLTYVSVQPEAADPATMRPLAMANGEHHVCRMTHTAAQHAIRLHIANARLIAAAPDLLEAARTVLAGLNARIDQADLSAVPVFDGIADLHAAISKAEGRS